MVSFYKDGKNVRPELMDAEAQKAAKSMEMVSKTQMRRIFNEIKRIDRQIDTEQGFLRQLPIIKMQKSKIAYAVKRAKDQLGRGRDSEQAGKNYDELKRFVCDGIDAVKDRQDYAVFCKYFEAMYGFYYEIARVK